MSKAIARRRAYVAAVAGSVLATGALVVAQNAAAAPAPGANSAPSHYIALASPARAFDSRTTSPRLRRGVTTVDLSGQITGSATSAVLNVTVAEETAPGYVVVYASGTTKPGTSNVNFQTGRQQANEVVTNLSADKKVDLSVDSSPSRPASAALIVDVVGYFTSDEAAPGGRISPVTPSRIYDSAKTSQPRRRGDTVVDVPASVGNATSVVLNVTVDGPDAAGFLVVYPTGATKPRTSNVNFARGQTQANEVFTKLGTSRRVTLSLGGSTPPGARLIVDLVASINPDSGQDLTVLGTPERALDTRSNSNVGASPGAKNGPVTITLPSSVPSDATAVVLNVTATGANASGYITVYPAGTTRPGTSNVNFRTAVDQANEVVTAISGDRQVTIEVGGKNAPTTHLIADVTGYLSGGTSPSGSPSAGSSDTPAPAPTCTPGPLPPILGSDCPSPSPSASASASGSATPSATTSASPSASVTPSTSASPTTSATASSSASPSASASADGCPPPLPVCL